ncbi:hypothetical protein NDU88_002193 [Pleurodeles waltl]|uniref:Uncharacterized protein n=1 Tax=Pleurodeles waltl TaxID=8319 RepID=A0AAV7VYN0_PLEWA|nr:hypothetical protein NDU88_002193 [Pleurodeles waltl]
MEGDRVGHLLARLIKTETLAQPILAAKDQEGCVVLTQQAINDIFATHLRGVYTAPSGVDEHFLPAYVAALPLLRLSLKEREDIGASLTRLELLGAVGALKTAKSPGGNGLLAEFFETFV